RRERRGRARRARRRDPDPPPRGDDRADHRLARCLPLRVPQGRTAGRRMSARKNPVNPEIPENGRKARKAAKADEAGKANRTHGVGEPAALAGEQRRSRRDLRPAPVPQDLRTWLTRARGIDLAAVTVMMA